jgi:hypothetical protein
MAARALCMALLLGAAPAPARELVAKAERIQQGPLVAEGVELTLQAAQQPGAGLGLQMRMQRLDVAALGFAHSRLDWRCELRPRDVDVWRCAGPLRSEAGNLGELALDFDRGTTELALLRGRARLQAVLPAEQQGAIGLQAERVPAEWLQPMLSTLWSQARLTGGFISADLDLDLALDVPRIEGDLRAEGLGVDTEDGQVAAAGLELQGRMGIELGEAGRIGLELALSGGELLAGAVYVALPAQPVRLELDAQQQSGRWNVERMVWDDPEALRVEASGELDFALDDALVGARLQVASRRADVLVSRYLDSILGTVGLPGLQANGGLGLTAQWDAGTLQKLHLEPDQLSLIDGQARFELGGLDGAVGFTRTDAASSNRISFERLRLYGLEFEPGALDWSSSGGELRLQRPARLGLLGGALQIETLRWNAAASADADDRFAASASLQSLDLGALSTALGWPPFVGALSGEIPGMHYSAGVLALEGTLRMQVFDGSVEVGGLSVERPFGVAPTLAADIELRSLDLQPLTAAFGFGEISGRMNGYIRTLRLVDWAPVAFDARFQTDEKADTPRRISQRAVRDLSSVGGMGAAAAIQQSVLRAFETFPYARIGIACRLHNHVCSMDGISRTASGYTLVEGSGLPRISVNGMQRQVDWPVLVDRLRAVTEGQRPKID